MAVAVAPVVGLTAPTLESEIVTSVLQSDAHFGRILADAFLDACAANEDSPNLRSPKS